MADIPLVLLTTQGDELFGHRGQCRQVMVAARALVIREICAALAVAVICSR